VIARFVQITISARFICQLLFLLLRYIIFSAMPQAIYILHYRLPSSSFFSRHIIIFPPFALSAIVIASYYSLLRMCRRRISPRLLSRRQALHALGASYFAGFYIS